MKTFSNFHKTGYLLIVTACLFLMACGNPVPPEKIKYAGEWVGPEM